MIRQVTMDVAIVDPTETDPARHDLVGDPPAGDPARADRAMEGHAATMPQGDQFAASRHPVPIDQRAQSATIALLVPSATTDPVGRNEEDVLIAVQVAAMARPRSACGPRAEHPRAETATPANVSLKRIAIPSASVRSVPFIRHPRFLRALRPKCLTALRSTN